MSVFSKMSLKDQTEICVLNAPDSFLPEIAAIEEKVVVKTSLDAADKLQYALAFVVTQEEVDRLSVALAEQLDGDGQIWFAYPKGSSKKYKCGFNRDTGWAVLGKLGFEGVRMVAIDEDWSALRFRRVQYIKQLNRSFAMSDEGKRRTGKAGENT